MMQEIDK